MRDTVFILILAGLILISDILAPKAYAYLDPGMGSYIFQIVIAFMVGGVYIGKVFWSRIVNFFKGLFAKKEKKDNVEK